MNAPVDAVVRSEALDPQTSFIVQAPAGSGKTELLTRRVLTLLGTVQEPEEILAITFTRKAASEMRQRVVEALLYAESGQAPLNEYQAEGLQLAQTVLQRDKEFNWQLINNPQRLNLRTIDALAAQLAHRMPVVSALGAPTGLIEDANALYQDVAARFIDEHLGELDKVLLHLGNRLQMAQSLLANMLSNRDQWSRHLDGISRDPDALRTVLETMLGELVESRLEHLVQTVPDRVAEQLPELLRRAAEFLLIEHEGDVGELTPGQQLWPQLDGLPEAGIDNLYAWQAVTEALLTQAGEWRRTVNKKSGFPAKTDAKKLGVEPAVLDVHKKSMAELLLSLHEYPQFHEALREASRLPSPKYQDEQWDLLAQVLGVLPGLLFELQWEFAERGVIDFVELSERAKRALGTEDVPTDLALSMDLQLRHVLVDEFQDTSQSQFSLFEKLVAGWSAGDGRTFFAVGDPMQSIYRFRDGDVALFGQASRKGIGSVKLKPLTLSVNFRSSPGVIDWVNRTFDAIFPDRDDRDTGAVRYSPSQAYLGGDGAVEIHPLIDLDRQAEAARVADIAASAIANDASHTVAILVRAKSHAVDIFNALRLRDLSYQSIDMDLLGERLVVRDLLSLVLALRYPHDRLHWLSLLRAPSAGLTLADLHILMADSERDTTVMDLLREKQRIALMSADGQARVQRFLSIVEPAVQRSSRAALMPWVEACWLQMGGPAACRDDIEYDAAERCLTRLQALEAEGRLWQKSVLGQSMSTLYATASEDPNCQIQVMTMHKAKGLEFDTVILPALDRKPRADGVQLFNWFESTIGDKSRLLLAPFEERGLAYKSRERLNRLVRSAKDRAEEQEKLRFLYVACTRAKSRLHLLGCARHNSQGELQTPIKSSLLFPLWPMLYTDYVAAAAKADLPPVHISAVHSPDAGVAGITADLFANELADRQTTPQPEEAAAEQKLSASSTLPAKTVAPTLLRLPADWKMPELPTFAWPPDTKPTLAESKALEFHWAGSSARNVGTVLHRHLQGLAGRASPEMREKLADLQPIIGRQLINMGVQESELSESVDKVLTGLRNTLDDERGCWILDSHTEARSEWAISVPTTLAGDALSPAAINIAADAKANNKTSTEATAKAASMADTSDTGGGRTGAESRPLTVDVAVVTDAATVPTENAPLASARPAMPGGGDSGGISSENQPATAFTPARRHVDISRVIIDRTFIDSDGNRWVVDFKTGEHHGGQREEFLDHEQRRYADQLDRYADIIRRVDDRPVRVGLYFPMLQGWREWQPAISHAPGRG